MDCRNKINKMEYTDNKLQDYMAYENVKSKVRKYVVYIECLINSG